MPIKKLDLTNPRNSHQIVREYTNNYEKSEFGLSLSRIISKHSNETIFYHYTSMSGLFSILSSKKLRLTNARYMNDIKELIHGRELIVKTLKTYNDNSFVKYILEEFILSCSSETLSIPQYFILSLINNNDDLTMFRLYGDSCTGCSVGIKISELDILSYKQNMKASGVIFIKPFLVDVIYEDSLKEDLIIQYIKQIIHWHLNVKLVLTELDNYLGHIIANLHLLTTCFKPAWFKEERETRLVIGVNEENYKVELDLSTKKPYIFLNDKSINENMVPSFIANITTGPNADNEQTVMSFMDFISINKIRCSKSKAMKLINKSKIPPLV